MVAPCAVRNVYLHAYKGRYLTHLSGVRSNCKLCSCEMVARNFSTLCAFRFSRRFMFHVRVRPFVLHSRNNSDAFCIVYFGVKMLSLSERFSKCASVLFCLVVFLRLDIVTWHVIATPTLPGRLCFVLPADFSGDYSGLGRVPKVLGTHEH